MLKIIVFFIFLKYNIFAGKNMPLEFWELSTVLTLVFVSIVVIALVVIAKVNQNNLAQKTSTRGANGAQGQTILLECPANQVISMYRAQYICTSNVNNKENTSCDPFYQVGGQGTQLFNPDTTLSAITDLGVCNGKGQCSFVVPNAGTVGNICNGTKCPGEIQLIATYDCVAPQ